MDDLKPARPGNAWGISVIAMTVALMAAQPVQAQTASILQGHVEGAAAGTTVTATDRTTGQRLTTKLNAQGDFTIVGVRPSNYHVEVAGNPPQDVVVPVGQTITVDFTPPSREKEIVVTGSKNRQQEVRVATVGTNVSQAQIENLPQNDRNFLNFAALAPGVQVTQGDHQVQAGAVSSSQTNVFIDGLSLKNPINHGGIAGQNFSQGNPFPQLAVQEFKVDTQNFKAEFEQAGSAIITAVTKTGGESFHGDAFIQWQPKSFIGRPFFDRPGEVNNPTGSNPKPNYDRKQYGADLGGPIIKDKLHFFFAFEGTTQTLPSATVNLLPTDNVPAAISSKFNGSYPQKFDQKLYFGKLTLFATAADTINGSAFVRKENNLRDFGGNSVPSHGHEIISDVEIYQLEWNHRADKWLNELTLAYNVNNNGTPRTSVGPEIALERGPDLGSGEVAFLGTNSFEQNDRQTAYTVKDNVTLFGGDHIIKGGFKVAFNTLSRKEDLQSNGTYYFNAATFTDFGTENPIAARISTIPVLPATANDTQIGLFVQDDWTPSEHWTINAGIRWDYETNAKNENFVTPPNVAAALRAYPGWKAAGINPEDYISTGQNRHPFSGAIQPRLGVAYDVFGNRDLIVFAGAGRYYDRPLFITAGIETIKNYYQSITTLQFCNGTGVTAPPAGCVNFTNALRDVNNLRALAIAQNTGGDVWLLNNNTKLPYSDQFDVGVRKRFGEIQTSISVSYVRSHNIFQFVRGNRYSNGWYSRFLQRDATGNVIGCTDGGPQWVQDNFSNVTYPGCPAGGGQLAGFNGKLNIGANDGSADYTALYLTAEKPFNANSRWGFSAALTLQRARSNDAQELNSDEFYNGPDQRVYGWQNVTGVEKFRFVGTGIVRGPWQTTLSGTLTLTSGPAFGNVIFKALTPDSACCYGNFGGAFFPHTTFGYKNLDLRIAKTFKMPWGHELTADFQAYNVFDWVNRSYSAWGAGAGTNPTFLENGTVGNARSYQAGLKYTF